MPPRVANTGRSEVINMHEAKTRLSELVARVERGEEIVIARDGRPAVRLVACKAKPLKRKLGGWKGKVRMAAGFDAPLSDDELAVGEGGA
jgi:prevent-host-death family protein